MEWEERMGKEGARIAIRESILEFIDRGHTTEKIVAYFWTRASLDEVVMAFSEMGIDLSIESYIGDPLWFQDDVSGVPVTVSMKHVNEASIKSMKGPNGDRIMMREEH